MAADCDGFGIVFLAIEKGMVVSDGKEVVIKVSRRAFLLIAAYDAIGYIVDITDTFGNPHGYIVADGWNWSIRYVNTQYAKFTYTDSIFFTK